MRTFALFLLAAVLCYGLVSLGFKSGRPGAPTGHSTTTSQSYTLSICCCGDTCQSYSVTFSNLALEGTSPADSSWIQQLPRTLHFRNVATESAKKHTFQMPGVVVEKMAGAKETKK